MYFVTFQLLMSLYFFKRCGFFSFECDSSFTVCWLSRALEQEAPSPVQGYRWLPEALGPRLELELSRRSGSACSLLHRRLATDGERRPCLGRRKGARMSTAGGQALVAAIAAWSLASTWRVGTSCLPRGALGTCGCAPQLSC